MAELKQREQRRGLSDAEVAAYKTDGLVVPERRLPPARLAQLQGALDLVIAANPEVRGERLIGAHVEKESDEGLKGHSAFLELARDDLILDCVEATIGPDIILWSTHIFCKPSGDGKEVPWHQDGHYWPIRPLATCSVWVALDDVTLENGAMGYIPGSHREQTLHSHHMDSGSHLALNHVLDSDHVVVSEARYNVLEAGQFSLHDVYLIHGSSPNLSPNRRAGLVLRYMPASSLFDRTIVRPEIVVDFSSMPIFLVRGVDRHGGNTFRVGPS